SRRSHTPVIRVRGRSRRRLSVAALACYKAGERRCTSCPTRTELRLGPAGATALLLDLDTDEETWRHLARRPLDSGRTTELYGGRIAPPAGR
ncbi:hypothetical protein ACFYM4_42900, partial [Streptomyces collinus]